MYIYFLELYKIASQNLYWTFLLYAIGDVSGGSDRAGLNQGLTDFFDRSMFINNFTKHGFEI